MCSTSRCPQLGSRRTVNSGDPRGSDNERIDEDLAREYGDTHDQTAG